MNGVQTIRLKLGAPLFYREIPAKLPADSGFAPFQYAIRAGELLFCFDLDPAQSRSIEPDPAALLGLLVFAGQVEGDAMQDEAPISGQQGYPAQHDRSRRLELPAGNYLFAQERDALNREECIKMAIEVQKDGLWERLVPADRLYVRYLFEDGRAVTQVFRPY